MFQTFTLFILFVQKLLQKYVLCRTNQSMPKHTFGSKQIRRGGMENKNKTKAKKATRTQHWKSKKNADIGMCAVLAV